MHKPTIRNAYKLNRDFNHSFSAHVDPVSSLVVKCMTMADRPHNLIRANFVRACKVHVFIGIAFIAQVIAYDASKLITPEVVLKRWVVAALLILVASVCWYLARLSDSPRRIHNLAWVLILTDMAVASFSVYTQRGMASRAVLLFIIPILVAATLQRKGAIYLTAIIAAVTYIVTAIAYFTLNFNEGYKIELYGEIFFYSAMLFTVASISWALVRSKH